MKLAREHWRVFCAIEVPAEIALKVTDHIRQLQNRFPDIKSGWNRGGYFHITLKFLGERPLQEVEAFSRAAATVASQFSPFKITVEGAGAFPPHGSPRVLWMGISDNDGQLKNLQHSLEEECRRAGFEREERSFHPHLTLARIKKRRGGSHAGTKAVAAANRERGFDPFEMTVAELIVFRSEPGKERSRYTVISRHPLSDAD